MGLIGTILNVIGLAIAMVGAIWILVIAFQDSVMWGLLCFFIPCVVLYYVFTHWEKTKKPFLIEVVGGVVAGIGSVIATSGGHG